MYYAIAKNGSYVKQFTDGEGFTKSWNWIEFYRTKTAAIRAAQRYGKQHGKGYSVVKMV